MNETKRINEYLGIQGNLPAHTVELIYTIENGLKVDSYKDRFIKRSDPIYKETERLHKKYFGDRTASVIRKTLVSKALKAHEISLLIIGVDSYLITLPEVIEDLNSAGFDGKIHVTIVDPLLDELQLELSGLIPGNGILGNVCIIQSKIENLKEGNWLQIAAMPGSRLAFANFSLHYVEPDFRNEVLLRLRKSCDQLLIVERDLQVLGMSTEQLIKTVFYHFLPLYERVGKSECNQTEKNTLYNWLGMIVRDALNDRTDVVCTHLCESLENWVKRISDAGFLLSKTTNLLTETSDPIIGINIFSLDGTNNERGFLGLIQTCDESNNRAANNNKRFDFPIVGV